MKSITLLIEYDKLNSQSMNMKDKMQGYFVVGVRSNIQTEIGIFWNNKKNLNYTELTPGLETTMTIEKDKPLYF